MRHMRRRIHEFVQVKTPLSHTHTQANGDSSEFIQINMRHMRRRIHASTQANGDSSEFIPIKTPLSLSLSLSLSLAGGSRHIRQQHQSSSPVGRRVTYIIYRVCVCVCGVCVSCVSVCVRGCVWGCAWVCIPVGRRAFFFHHLQKKNTLHGYFLLLSHQGADFSDFFFGSGGDLASSPPKKLSFYCDYTRAMTFQKFFWQRWRSRVLKIQLHCGCTQANLTPLM